MMDQYEKLYQSNLPHDFAKSYAEHQYSTYHGGHISGQYHGYQYCLPMIDRRYFPTSHQLQQVPVNPRPYMQHCDQHYQQGYIQPAVPFPQTTLQDESYNHMLQVGNRINPYLFNDYETSARVVKEETLNVNQYGISMSNEKVPAHPNARKVKTSKKKERYRTVYTAQQKKVLEDAFNENTFVKPERKKELVEETGLTNKQVLYWFQNRRAKHKRMK